MRPSCGEMTARGLKEATAAKADGRWDNAYDAQRDMAVPRDFQQLLDRHPRAAKSFADLSKRIRFAVLYRIHDAKRPETRQRRMTEFLTRLKAGETFQ